MSSRPSVVTVVPPRKVAPPKRMREYDKGFQDGKRTAAEELETLSQSSRKEGFRAGFEQGKRQMRCAIQEGRAEKAKEIRKLILHTMKHVHPDRHDVLCPSLVSQKLVGILNLLKE